MTVADIATNPTLLPTPQTQARYTAPQASQRDRAFNLAGGGLFLACIAAVAVTGEYLTGIIGIAALVATVAVEIFLGERTRMSGRPDAVFRITIPLATLVALLLPGWRSATVLMVATVLLSVLADWAPWRNKQNLRNQINAGWMARKNPGIVFGHIPLSAFDGLLSKKDKTEDARATQEALDTWLPGRPEWDVYTTVPNTNVVGFGPAGLVGVFYADLTGRSFTHRPVDTSQVDKSRGTLVTDMVARGVVRLPDREGAAEAVAAVVHTTDEQLIHDANAHMREFKGDFLRGSRAWRLKQEIISAVPGEVNVELRQQAMTLTSEFTTEDGHDAGLVVPLAPTRRMACLASCATMSGEHNPVTIIAAYGANMNAPWGRVHVRNDDGSFNGTAILCHPGYLGECIDSLPGVFDTTEQMESARQVIRDMLDG